MSGFAGVRACETERARRRSEAGGRPFPHTRPFSRRCLAPLFLLLPRPLDQPWCAFSDPAHRARTCPTSMPPDRARGRRSIVAAAPPPAPLPPKEKKNSRIPRHPLPTGRLQARPERQGRQVFQKHPQAGPGAGWRGEKMREGVRARPGVCERGPSYLSRARSSRLKLPPPFPPAVPPHTEEKGGRLPRRPHPGRLLRVCGRRVR